MSERSYSVSATREIEDPDWNGDDEKDNRGGELRCSAWRTEWEPVYSWQSSNPEPGGIEDEEEVIEFNGEEMAYDEFCLMWGEQHEDYLKRELDACFEAMEGDE